MSQSTASYIGASVSLTFNLRPGDAIRPIIKIGAPVWDITSSIFELRGVPSRDNVGLTWDAVNYQWANYSLKFQSYLLPTMISFMIPE